MSDFLINPQTQTPYANSQHNIEAACEKLNAQLSYDRLRELPLLDAEPITDALVDDLWLAIDQHFQFRPNRDFFHRVIMSMARRNSFHPILDYFSQLQWDRVSRAEELWIRYFGAEDTPYVRAVARIWLVACVRRLKQPGCKFDELVILEGAQGAGKSTAIAKLVGPSWFSDSLKLNTGSKILIEQSQGFMVLEAAELQGMNKVDWDKLKHMLSQVQDTARLAYNRLPTTKLRNWTAIGTTNGESYLRDPTGNRRFWPIRVQDTPIDWALIEQERDQLWAEAVALEAQGVSIRLPQDLWEVAREQQEQRMVADPWFELLEDAIGRYEQARVQTNELWKLLKEEKPHLGHADRLARIMKQLGWRRGADKGRFTLQGKRVHGWVVGEPVNRNTPLPLLMFDEGIPNGGALVVVAELAAASG